MTDKARITSKDGRTEVYEVGRYLALADEE